MPTIETLTVDVETNTSKFTKGLKIAAGGLAALGAAAIYAFGQFEESEKVAAQTDAVIKSTGNSANVTAKHVSDLANALARKTGIDDEAIQTGQNMILTFKNISNEAGKGNDIFDQTTKAVLDMSVAMGQDMKSSAIQVGKALNDPIAGITALTRVGVTFTEQQKKQIEGLVKHGDLLSAQKIILQELTSEFGGSAEAQATSSGKMQVALGNLAETVGGLLAPVIQLLITGLTQAVNFLKAHVGPALEAAQEWFTKLWDKIGPVVTILGQNLVEAATQIWHIIEANFIPALKRLWESFQPVLKVLGLVVGAILIIALETLPIIFKAIGLWLDLLSRVVEFIGDKFVGPIVRFFERIVDWIREHWGPVWTGMKETVGNVVGPIVDFINRIIDVVKTLFGWVMDAVHALEKLNPFGAGGSQPAGSFKGQIPSPMAPKLQHGGMVAATGLAVVHAGETVIPAGMGAGVTVNIGTLVGGNITEVARALRDELVRLGVRNAGTGL